MRALAGVLIAGLAASAAAGATAVLVPAAGRPSGSPRVRKATAGEMKDMAAAIERRLDRLARQLKDENAEFERAGLALISAAGTLDRFPEGSEEARR